MKGLSDADRRLAHQIAAGVLRNRRSIDARIANALSTSRVRMRPALRDVLRIGAYQLCYLDRIPDYAAVGTAVDLARRRLGERSVPLVNAVLRTVERNRTQPSQDEGGVAQRHSHPDWLVKKWKAQFGRSMTERLLEHNNRQPATVIRPIRWSATQLSDALTEAQVDFDTVEDDGGFEIRGVGVTELPGYHEGAFIVQDPCQQQLLRFADLRPGMTVWDACAAPGGKALVLEQSCQVVATEWNPRRLERLRDNARRVAPPLRIVRADAARPPLRARSFDAVVLDVPCSATGTMARHPDARWNLTPTRLAALVRLQRRLLDGACNVVRIDGLLLYLTCSLEPEENEDQIDGYLERHPNFVRDGTDLHVFPPDSGWDGGYGARLRRVA